MRDLLLLTAFVLIMAYLQARQTNKIVRYNNNLTSTQIRKIDKGTYMIIAMIIMMLLAMLRGVNIGNDTDDYHKIFINVITNPDYANITRYEIGYIFLNKVVGKFTTNPQGIIIVTSFIYYIIYLWFIKRHSRNYALSLILFFLFVFPSSLSMVRQELAIAFTLIAYDRVINKKTLFAYFWIIIAILFHSSAIVFLVVPILPHIKFNKALAVALVLLVAVLTVTNALFRIFAIIAPQYSHYFGGQYVGSGALAITYQLLRNAVFLVVGYMVINQIQDNKIVGVSSLNCQKQNNLVKWILLMSVVILIFGYRINLVNRISVYFSTFYLTIVPNILKRYDNRSRKFLTIAMVCIMITYSIVTQIFRPEWYTIYPYQFFWQ